MYKRFLSIAILILGISTGARAQAPAGFEEFRRGLMENFNSFKNRILEHYADFLAGEWHEYEPLEAESKYSVPKPESLPAAEELAIEEGDEKKKELLMTLGFRGTPTLDNEGRFKEPSIMGALRDGSLLHQSIALLPNKLDEEPQTEENAEEPGVETPREHPARQIMTGQGIVGETDEEVFGFYGMEFALPRVDFTIMDTIKGTLPFSQQWERLSRDSVAEKLTPHILALQKQTGLSDYLMFEMTMAYLDNRFSHANDASKMSAAHYLLAHMGFGVRIAIDDNDEPFILLPFKEKVFGRARIPLAKTYYVFGAPGRRDVKRVGLRSPYVPDNAEQGKDMDLRLAGLNLPEKKFHYDIVYDGLRLEGDLNENVMPMLYRYPQMDTSGFAASMVSPAVRKDVVRQVKEQLGDMEPLQAADRLLSMIQFGFPYATDDNYHGFEKPYFFEEMLYYPKSDCEDRAVFFSYLLWNALGLENDLITYPNHEATAIKAESVWGGFDHYLRSGEKFFISDPTYQGAPTGQCMPQYVGLEPGIDHSYH